MMPKIQEKLKEGMEGISSGSQEWIGFSAILNYQLFKEK